MHGSTGSDPIIAAHMEAMNFYEKYVEMVRVSMSEDPVLRLAMSLDSASLRTNPKAEAVREYVRSVDEPQADVAMLAAADRIVRGQAPAMDNGISLRNLMINLGDAGGMKILDLSGSEALEVVDRIWNTMPRPS